MKRYYTWNGKDWVITDEKNLKDAVLAKVRKVKNKELKVNTKETKWL